MKYTKRQLEIMLYIYYNDELDNCIGTREDCDNNCPLSTGKHCRDSYKKAKKILKTIPKEDLLELGISLVGE